PARHRTTRPHPPRWEAGSTGPTWPRPPCSPTSGRCTRRSVGCSMPAPRFPPRSSSGSRARRQRAALCANDSPAPCARTTPHRWKGEDVNEMLFADRQRLLELLRTHSFERRQVTLASGRTSNFYIDCKRTTLRAEGHWLVGRLLLERVLREAPEARAVGGLTLGADPIASAVSMASWMAARPLEAFIVRKEAKGHGTKRWIEGPALPPGTPVAIVEDVVTTGGSGLLAAEKATEAGLRVLGIFALVDRREGGREAVEARGLRLYALFDRSDFLGPEE